VCRLPGGLQIVGEGWLTPGVGQESGGAGEQFELLPELALVREQARQATERTEAQDKARATRTAPELPVAKVLVDLPLAHLDREFDYLVPEQMHEQVVPGSRVKVRFAGQDVDGFVLARVAGSEHGGQLRPLRRAVSAEPVLTPQVARLVGLVADRYAGTRADVLRLAVPPRHARVEKEARRETTTAPLPAGEPAGWPDHAGGLELLAALQEGQSPRAVWTCLPGDDWAADLAAAVAATVRAGRGALVCVPDHRDLARLDAATATALGEGRHAVLSADLGPAARYRSFLSLARGDVRVAIGTRAAAYAPVCDLGLVAIWDDGDDLFAEPRAPYPHTREVLLLRAHDEGTAALLGSYARSVESSVLVETGWAHEIVPERATLRTRAPRVSVAGATEHDLARDPWARSVRMPAEVHRTLTQALSSGPVLVQTPRAGYAVSLACETCRAPARCRACHGPLHQPRAELAPSCRWCGAVPDGFRCPECDGVGLRAPVLGERRTAEEIGRAFPGVTVRRSSAERVLDEVDAEPVVVVATPGAEPAARGGYAAVVLLDTWLMLARPDLRTGEESLRRWLAAASLARPASEGGRVLVVGDAGRPAVQSLVRWDPAGFAAREADERRAVHLPPASRLAVLSASHDELDAALGLLRLPPGAEVLGPAPDPVADDGETERVVIRVPRVHGSTLSTTLRQMSGVRAAHKLPPVRVHVDPWSLP
jgi:primosomal protein N' (replication factor Y) (superfamily II helicase)